MDKGKQTNRKGKYTLEFKLEAVRQVLGGQAAVVTTRVLGVPKQTKAQQPPPCEWGTRCCSHTFGRFTPR
jgi:hypothetical protein